MIEWKETFKRKGYTPSDLKRGSHKKVVRRCDMCNKKDEIMFFDKKSFAVCVSCAAVIRCKKFKHPQLGKPHTMKMKIKISCGRRKINVDDFCGFVSSTREALMRTDEYKQWRLSIFKRDDFICKECGTRGGDITAHHILPYRDYSDIQYVLNIMNGITLCKKCHEMTFGKEYEFADKYLNWANGSREI